MKSTPLAIIAASAILSLPLLNAAIPSDTALPVKGLQPIPEGPGKRIMEQTCTGCHSLSVVISKRATPEEWGSVVQQMVSRGASASDQDIATLTQYLAKNMGPGAPDYALPAAATTPPVEAPAISSEETPDSTPISEPPSPIHINVNRADARELETLLSLTPPEASALISYRDENGPFQNWQEVGEVPGVPAGKIIQYKNRIVF